MITLGKCIYIYQIGACLGGDIDAIVQALVDGHYQSVILHATSYSTWPTTERIALATAIKAAGIIVLGGIAVYGNKPQTEGKKAGEIVSIYGLDGMVFDAEDSFDLRETPDSNAVHILKNYRIYAPEGAVAGWCYWAFWGSASGMAWATHDGSSVSRKGVIWAATADNYGGADFVVPMMYWNPGSTVDVALTYIELSIAQYRQVDSDVPILPIGRAYVGQNGTPTPAAIAAFDARARELGCIGTSWWSMQHALALDGIWEALAELKPWDGNEVSSDLTDTQKLALLWDAHPELHPEMNE